MTHPHEIALQRIYDETPEDEATTRVLVDRLWPRGISKERARLDLWLRDVAPSNELRKWYAHDPEKTAEFTHRYRLELQDVDRAAALSHLRELASDGPLVLLTASKALDLSHATVLRELLSAPATQ